MHTYKSHAVHYRLVKEVNSLYHQVNIKSSHDAADFIRPMFGDNLGICEEFHIILLNQRNNTIGNVRISQGGITATIADVRMIGKYALESLATAVILAHNHPSGNCKPSQADIQLTQKAKSALALFDINVLDHVILTEESYYSLADEGVL